LPLFQNYDIFGTDAAYNVFNLNGNNTGVQTISAAVYGTVNMANGGTNQKRLAGNATFRGNFTLSSGAFNDGGFTLSLLRNLTNSATTPANGSITSTGSGKILFTGGLQAHVIAAAVAAPSFGNLELDDASGISGMTGSGVTTINGNVTVTNGVFTIGAHTTSWNVTGNVSIASAGNLTFSSATGAKNVTGDVTINGTWSSAGTFAHSFGGNLINNGTFIANTGIHSFTGSAKQFGGSNQIRIPSFTLNGTYTNNCIGTYTTANSGLSYAASGGLIVATSSAGTGTLTQGTGGALLVINPIAVFAPTLTANAVNNTVVYNTPGGTTVIKPTTYYNLHLDPTTTATHNLSGVTTILNNLTLTPAPTTTFTFQDNTFQLIGPGTSSGTFRVTNANPVVINHSHVSTPNVFPVFQNYDFHPTNTTTTLRHTGTVAHNIPAGYVFGNLTLGNNNVAPVGSGTKTVLGNFTVKGILDISDWTVLLNVGSNTITVNGNLYNRSTNGYTTTGVGKIRLAPLAGFEAQHLLFSRTVDCFYGNLELDDINGVSNWAATNVRLHSNFNLVNGNYNFAGTAQLQIAGTVSRTNGFFVGYPNSVMTITGSGALGNAGSIHFAPGYENLGTFAMNGSTTTGRSVNLGTPLTIHNAGGLSFTATNGGLINLGNNDLTLAINATVGVRLPLLQW
jgi:hypothetical protein